MAYFNDRITVSLTAVEMAAIREALRYAAEQVYTSDIPVFESFESPDKDTGELIFDETLYQANQDKAGLALELADTLDLIEAASCDWTCLNSECGGHFSNGIEVWCRHHKTEDLSTPLVREFVWSYVPKHSALPSTVFTTVFTDHILAHFVPYSELDGKDVVKYYTFDELMMKTPIITGDEDTDTVIVEALRNFVRHG